ncbi:hypothetical protein [Methylobrevis pamukkalensis]|uniref:Uncharacterized protein n=1 Tax=Methylobrevis pamukkalensis TaxID=1439726 RepID=A0A1E3H0E0_9HYPH|nr:hypothetical protein [Methylobrevis pamukkalensis]ODN69783.1 hypothetical protein A6302_02905 [Methylobrevis pamukkalensis]
MAPPQRPRRRGPGARILRVGLVLLLVGLAAGIWLFVRLTSQPLYSEMLADEAEIVAGAMLGEGSAVDIGAIGLSIDDGLAPVIHLRDVRARLRGGNVVSVDTLTATTAWSTLLGRGRNVTRLSADHVVGEMVAGEGVEIPDPLLMLAYLESELAHAGLGSAEIGSLTVYSLRTDGVRIPLLENAAVTLASPVETADRSGTVDFRVAGAGAGGPWSARIEVRPDPATETSRIKLSARTIDVADLARRMGDARPPSPVRWTRTSRRWSTATDVLPAPAAG